MKALYWTTAIILAGAWACGGSDATDDGGTDGSPTNDGSTFDQTNPLPDSGPNNDATTTFDTGTDGTTVVDSGAFDPSSLGTSLVLWLDGTKDVVATNNAVTSWADQTTNHNDANGGSGQTAHQPSVNKTAINNLPAIEFTGGNANQYLQITDSASLQFGTADFAIFMVASNNNPSSGQGEGQGTYLEKVAGLNGSGPQLYANGAGLTPNTYVGVIRARINATDNVDSTAANYNDNKFHRIGIRRNGAAIEVWTDGVATSFSPDAGGNVDVGAATFDLFIGGSVANGQAQLRLIGAVAEVVGVKGTIAGGDVTNLDGYFKTKYGL